MIGSKVMAPLAALMYRPSMLAPELPMAWRAMVLVPAGMMALVAVMPQQSSPAQQPVGGKDRAASTSTSLTSTCSGRSAAFRA